MRNVWLNLLARERNISCFNIFTQRVIIRGHHFCTHLRNEGAHTFLGKVMIGFSLHVLSARLDLKFNVPPSLNFHTRSVYVRLDDPNG